MHAKLYCIILAAALLCSIPPAVRAKDMVRGDLKKDVDLISPSGLALLDEKLNAYPEFDEKKIKDEAEEKYKLAKIGDKVTLKGRKGEISGTLMERDAKSIRVDDKKIIFMDMDADDLARFSEEKCGSLRAKYLQNKRSVYEYEFKEFSTKIRKSLEDEYPAVGARTVSDLFSKMRDKDLRERLMSEFADEYDKSLPLKGGKTAHIAKLAEKFAEERKLSFDGKRIRTAAEVEDEKGRAEAEARRADELKAQAAKRAADRTLFPRTASPTFNPDGGTYAPRQKVELSCATKGATVRYTLDGREPTEDSPEYKEPIVLENPRVVIKARAFHPSYNDSDTAACAPFLETGAGLMASYFNAVDCTGKAVTRIDKTVDFDWAAKSPDPAIPDEYFSALWAGSIVPKFSETYKFYVSIDNGSRLWIGDSLVIDHWVEDVTTQTADIKLTAGSRYDFKLAFCETWGVARIKLEWSSPSVPRQVVPQDCLYPYGRYADQLVKWNQTENGVYVNRPGMANPLSNGKTTIVKAGKNPNGKDRLEDHINR